MLSKPHRNFHLMTLCQIRLVGSGSTQCSGRVEVQHNGVWGTVCDDDWDLNDAKVVCRQLSCGTALQATKSAQFGQGSGEIWLDQVACSGTESSLTQCRHIGYGTHNCKHHEDAGVICSGQIRLVGSGSTQCSGRVEVQHNGVWGTVCDDDWDLNDAKVVCRQLSCGPALKATESAQFGQGSGEIWLDQVACSGTESSLTQCLHIGYGTHDCNHGEDAGVICSGPIRLVGSGSTRCSGRVEVQHNGVWGTVCDDGWDLNDANVVCRQLSCGTARLAPGSAHFGQGSGQIWLDELACSGSEISLTICRHRGYGTHNCNHGKDAGVFCSVNFDHDGSYWCQYEKTASGQTFTSSQSYPLSLRVTVSLQMPNISLTSPGAESVWGPGEADITRGYNFTFTCSIIPESPQGRFFLIFSGDTKRRNSSAVNNSATFTFPLAQFEHQGNYSCVYVVTTSSHMFTSPESALITVAVKHSLLLLSLLVSGGIFLLLLFISVLVCLVQRRRKLRHPTVFFQTQTTSTERDEDNAEFDEDFYGQSIPSKLLNQSEDEDSDDYENPVFDENIHYQETGSRSHGKCISAKSESREEETDEEDEGTSDDDNDYENVTEHFHQPVENDYAESSL
ncbi:Deleted in malignant brain tumors 1 protein [Oryzias melastigma]|uniref:Deleted in malignant brain tumors 1 protein n=1 Tax=Oryzias melastigma TaxID=30732 RepID=A0A834C941_ORYME|nr:Deleted in malignant brain tumors 1 protein [Oryzias melastigma]